MTKPSTTTQETRELEPEYIGSDEVWPLPWLLSPDQLELRDANGYTVIKAWNGHANILYAHKAVNSHAALTDEVTRLREETLKGICVYCGYVEQYESLDQKNSEQGNQMRIAHIRQCAARPELKLIAEVTRLREALDEIRQYRNTCMICMDSPDDTELEVEYRKGARAVLSSVAVIARAALQPKAEGEEK
jgi:hypothetical protein